MGRWTLAIDFGTSFTTAVTAVDGNVVPVEIANSRYLPSTVAMEDGGALLTGPEALQRARHEPESAVRLPKRALVAGPKVRLGGRTVATTDLVAAVLGRAAAEARAAHGGAEPAETTLTHPAGWCDDQLAALRKAAAAAGLGTVRLVAEPIAAAAHYVVGCAAAECRAASRLDLPDGAYLAVYDLGGGTFDTAVVQRAGAGFVLVGEPGGDPALGGEDFDERLLELLAERAADRDPDAFDALDPAVGGPPARRARVMLRRDITEAKQALSRRVTVDLAIPGFPATFRVTRREFTEIIEADLRRTADLLRATVTGAGLDPSDLAAVALAGGSSRVPRVAELIAETFGALPLMAPDPKSSVAHGALLEPVHETPPPPSPPPPASSDGGTAEAKPLWIDPDPDGFLPEEW
ncbi:Hsp70 family protein [Actinomadura chibensis]|nr:Hsp70 family protein [Actinomadura chibensis]